MRWYKYFFVDFSFVRIILPLSSAQFELLDRPMVWPFQAADISSATVSRFVH